MSDQVHLMVPNLRHARSSMGDAEFFAHIDECGGWPIGFGYVGFEHTESRSAGFCNSPRNSGWWTVVASADDYYLWKLSPAALQRIADAVIDASRPTRVDAQKVYIKGFCGFNAARAKEPQA